jgi:hypothetical protein
MTTTPTPVHWNLFLDDMRSSTDYAHAIKNNLQGGVVEHRTSAEAIEFTKKFGPPAFMFLDHDLGGEDTSMVYLKWLADEYPSDLLPPEYTIISANPVGAANIDSFMRSWSKSVDLGGKVEKYDK